jgi:SNF2 family DNA or RNA helicase
MIFVEATEDKEYLQLNFKPVKYHLNRVKEIMGAKFNPDKKIWTVPMECFDEVEEVFKGEIIWVTPRHEITGEPPPPPPKFWSKIPRNALSTLKLPLFNFQVFGAQFLAYCAEHYGKAVLGDMMGIGKTPQGIGGAELMRERGLIDKTLVVVLSPLKWQWDRDGIQKFTDRSSIVIHGTPQQRLKQYQDAVNKDYVIINYELLLKDFDVLSDLDKRGILRFDLVIFDEAHKLKNRLGKMNQAASKLNIKYKFLLTGTPVMNKPEEMFGLMQVADKDVFGKFTQFAKKFLNYQYNGKFNDLVGYKNLDELREIFAQFFLRRTDREVEMELPDMVEVNEYVEMTPFQRKLDKELQEASAAASNRVNAMRKKGIDGEELKKAQGAAQGYFNLRIGLFDAPELFTLSHSESVYQKYGTLVENTKGAMQSPKLERLLEIVEELVENGEKVIIFTQFKTMVKIIRREIKKRIETKLVCYYGGTDAAARDEKIRKFRDNKDFKVFISTEAGSTGLNLQFARYLINYDLPWNPAIWEQRKGRIRRLGSQFTKVKVINLMVKDSIDELMYQTLEKKQNVVNALIENDSRQSKRLSKLSAKAGEEDE